MQNKNDLVRPIYGELINVFRAIPIAEKIDYNKVTVDSDYEERINYLIARVEKVSNEDFSEYKIKTRNLQHSDEKLLNTDSCRSCLGAIIGRIYAKYYPTEPDPLNQQSNTILSQVQHVEQHLNVELKAFITTIENALQSNNLDTQERNFLKEIKNLLASANDISDIVKFIISSANLSCLTIEKLSSLFNKIF